MIQRSMAFDAQSPNSEHDADWYQDACRVLGAKGDLLPEEFGQRLRAFAAGQASKSIRTLSLFSGAGGLDIGFHDARFEIVGMVEVEKAFCATLAGNVGQGRYFSDGAVHHVDIRKFLADPVADPSANYLIENGIDFIIGGPPCQTFSAAGRRASGVIGLGDDRGTLFEEYIRLLDLLQPQGFLFENVYGITGAQNGEAWAAIREGFQDAGYEISYRILDAADFGVPQHRERLFIVGTKGRGFRFPRPTHGPDCGFDRLHVSARQAVAGAKVSSGEASQVVGGQYAGLLEDIPPGLNYSFFTKELGHPQPRFAWRSKFSDFLYKADPDRPVRTLKAQGGQFTGPFHWESRPFGSSELKRLQTFPDEYVVKGGKQVFAKQIGNSVPPQLARVLALAIREQLFDSPIGPKLPTLGADEALGFRKRKRLLTAHYRDVARRALSGVPSVSPRSIKSRRYRARLENDFALSLVGEGALRQVSVRGGVKVWTVKIGDGAAATVSLRPRLEGGGWDAGAEEIRLRLGAPLVDTFPLAWKVLSAELANAGIKEDVVQLCGYYQYSPKFSCDLQLSGDDSREWRLVSRVVEGIGVGETLSRRRLAGVLECEEGEVAELMLLLRRLGFEVRNWNTNHNIPMHHYLIPYAFPTLGPKSVQLRKSLT